MFKLIPVILSLFNRIAKYFNDRQLINAGKAIERDRQKDEAIKSINKANNARNNIKHNSDSVRNDPNNRS